MGNTKKILYKIRRECTVYVLAENREDAREWLHAFGAPSVNYEHVSDFDVTTEVAQTVVPGVEVVAPPHDTVLIVERNELGVLQAETLDLISACTLVGAVLVKPVDTKSDDVLRIGGTMYRVVWDGGNTTPTLVEMPT